MIRLRFMAGAWVGMRGHLESDALDILAGIATASPYNVMLHDRPHGPAGTCNWSRNQIHVAVRGIVTWTLAHEVWHSVARLIPAADYAVVAEECARLFPVITPRLAEWGWTLAKDEREACWYAAWRVGIVGFGRPSAEVEAVFQAVSDGRYAARDGQVA